MGIGDRVKVRKQRLSKERGREEHVRMVSEGVAEDEKQGNRPKLSLPPPRQTPTPRITT